MSDDILLQRVAHTLTEHTRRIDRLEVLEGGGGTASPGTATWPGYSDGEGNPANLGTAALDGTSDYPARRDHAHTYGTALLVGLNADLLDGQHATAFSGTAHTHTLTGYLPTTGGTMTGDIAMGGNDITNLNQLLTPTVRAVSSSGLRLADDSSSIGVFVQDGGNVGIKTDTPAQALDVAGNIATSGGVFTRIVRASGTAGLRLEDDGEGLGLFVEDGGQVGIGTATPAQALDVLGNIAASGTIYPGSAVVLANDTYLTGTDTGATLHRLAGIDSGNIFRIGSKATGSLTNIAFHTPSTDDAMTITDAGNVGIGTATPSYPLHVSGTAAVTAPLVLGGAGDVFARLMPPNTVSIADMGSVSIGSPDGFLLVYVGGQKQGALYGLRGTSGAILMASTNAGVFGTALGTDGDTNVNYSNTAIFVENQTGATRAYTIYIFGEGNEF